MELSCSLTIKDVEMLRLGFWVLELWATAAAETISGEGGMGVASHPQPCVQRLRVSTNDFVTV
jgi:hypothetical protein